MKVLLTEPISSFIPTRVGFYCPNNGILSLASYLERFRFEVKIIDPWLLRLNWKGLLDFIKRESPDVVGITSLTCNAYNAMALAKLIKKINPNITVVAGGHHFSSTPIESLMICDDIDYIVIGEGEKTFLELLRSLQGGIKKSDLRKVKGLAFRLDDDFVITSPRPQIDNLDTLPIPAYHLLFFTDNIRIPLVRQNSLGCIFSRGCDRRCLFCSEALLWGYKRRGFSARRIVEEIEFLFRRYSKYEFSFEDPDFLFDRQRNIQFIEELSKLPFKIKFRFAARVDTVIRNRDLLKDFQKIGLTSIVIGIESFDQIYLEKWNKQINLEQIYLASKYIKEAKIPVFEGLTVLDPYTGGIKDVIKIIKESHKLKINVLWSTILTPFPGTPLYHSIKRNGKIKVWDYRKYNFYHATTTNERRSLKKIEVYNMMIYFGWFYNPICWIKNMIHPERKKYQIFQLFFDLRIIKRILHSATLRMKNDKYFLFIKDFYLKHMRLIDKERKEEKSVKLWYRY